MFLGSKWNFRFGLNALINNKYYIVRAKVPVDWKTGPLNKDGLFQLLRIDFCPFQTRST
jgi:hypothetical protein